MPRSLYTRVRVKALAVALAGLFVVLLGVTTGLRTAQAAASSNLNFQARLLTSSGAVVPDGTYNIDFKLYTADSTTGTVGTCTGACVWEETRTGGNKVTVINGYFSVNLGSVTAFGSSINWDQQLWLTMNIGGTGASPTWDGEMQNAGHSIALTALPFAFAANKLTSGTGSSRGTLSFAGLGQATAITLPDPGAASATVCYQSASACGFAPGTAANYIQNGTSLQTNANFNIQSAAIGSVGAIINAASGQTADIFELKNSSIVFSVGNNGQTLFKPTATNDSVTFFQIQPAGSATPTFNVDTSNGRVGIGTNSPSFNLHVVKSDNLGNEGNYPEIRVTNTNTTGASIASVDAESAENGVIAKLLVDGNGGAGATASNVGGATGTKSNHPFFLYTNNTARVKLDTSGNVGIGTTGSLSSTLQVAGTGLFQTGTDSTTAFQLQDHTGTSNLLVADTTTNRIGIGKAPNSGYQLDVAGSIGSQTRFVINSSATSSGTVTKKTAVGTGGVSANDVVVLNSSGQAVDTTTARDIRVYGVSLTTTASGSSAEIALTGNITVNADTAAINVGDQLATSTTSGRVTKDNNATTGILGVALTSKAAGSNGTVDVALGQVRGQYNPVFRTNSDNAAAFQVQNAASGQAVMAVDTANNQLVLGTAGTSGLNGKLVFSTTNASNTTITIQAASTAASYSLTLPTSGPALGQCLQNDGTTVGQLTFGPCGANGTFVNFAPSSAQTDSSTNNSIFINKTGASGNILELQKSGSDVFNVANNGDITATGKYNGNTFTSTSLVFSGASAASLQSASSQALNITGNASSLWQVAGTNQNLTIQTSGTGTLAIDTTGGGTVSLGAANAASINIGSSNSTAISIGSTSLVGTVTNKVQGLTTTLTGAASNSSYVVKSTSNSNGTFQVQNSGGNKVFSVDTTAGQTVLGQSSSVNGSLLFQNSGGTNGITLNSTGAASSYTLTLPTTAPAGGLCIETSTGNSSQLVFASCSNNNASIQEVSYWDANNTNLVTVSPTTVGDEMVVTTQIPSSGVTVTNVSGGGVTTWSKVVANAGNGTVNRVELWVGTVTTTGSSTLTVTYSSSPGANEITATEFTAAGVNASTSWGIESSSAQLNSTASTTVTFPSATAVNGSELYIGYAQVQNPPAITNGSSGFSYIQTSTQHNIITYNPSLTANATYQPTALQNSAGQSNTVDVVLTAFVTSTSINNTTSLQKANFYVQAASAGSVAGVLQAASTGTADILDLKNSGGTNVMTIGSTGLVTIKSAASTSSFQVQNTSGYGILTVDSSNSKVVLGQSSSLGGVLTFADASDANTITIQAPSSVAASYTLALPTNTPTAGLCLGTSPSNANQLIFASCATQVSAASITYVNQWSNTSLTTLPDSPAATGNLLVLFSHSPNNVNITGVSGGGVTNWTKVTSNIGAAGIGNDEMWRGVVTATGSATISVTYSSAAGANELVAQEYTMGGTGGGTWAIDTSGTTTGTNTTINYPSLTPASSSELYAGYAWSANTMSAGSTSGYTYTATSGGKYTVRNTNVTGGVAQQPTASQSVSGNYNSIAALIQAFAGTSVIVNSTATQQANFNVQAALSGTVAGVLQGASSGTADILQVKDGSGNNVMSVNGTSGITLGTPIVSPGTLVFASGNSNTITITAPSTPGTNILLKLPSAAAAPGQCLAASPSDSTQLVFSSCANQVTSVAISFVNNWKSSGNNISTLNISPTNLNDLIVFFSSPRNGVQTTGVSGCSITWSKVSGSTAGSGADTSAIDMYKGVVTTTGACTLTATFSGSQGNPNEMAAMEFTTGSTSGSWVVDASNTQFNAASTTMTFPSLTPQSSRDLYVGYGAGGTYSSGSSTGFTYLTGSLTNRVGLYNTNVNAASQPTATTASSASITVGALVAAYSSSSVISNSTVTQQANFNIQAATSGSVAGVLQAFPTGTGDILDMLDGAGNLVGKFDYQGNLLVRPSTPGATAFQVQNTSNVNVLSVDTSAKQVVVGSGSAGETSVSVLVLDNQTGSSADPATAVNGAMYYNAVTHSFRCAVAGSWQNCAGLLYANTSKSSANSNCSNNCAAFSTAAAVPANYCQAGKVIRLSANGYFSSQATATNIQFGIYYGTDSANAANDVLIGSVSPAVSVTSASNNYFQINFDINCFSTTSMQAGGALSIQTGAASSGLTAVPMNATNAATVVTSSAKNLYIFPIWSAASASNTATLAQFGVNAP